MGNLIVVIIILVLTSGSLYKIYKDKKNNVKCSGCPYANSNIKCKSRN